MPGLADVGRFIAKNPGTVTGIGAGLGAIAGAGREALRPDGQRNYLSGAVRGAVGGGMLGAGTAGIAHAARDTQLLRPGLSGLGLAKGTAEHIGEGVSNFAQRQFHGLTGYGAKDTAYLDRIGIQGSGTSAQKARLLGARAQDDLAHLPQGASFKDWVAREGGTAKIHDELHKHVNSLAQEGEVGDRLRNLGMTNAPGAMKAMVTNPREAAKAVWDQFRGGGGPMGTANAALAIGAPAALAAHNMAKGDESAQGGQSMQEKALRGAMGVGTGVMFGGMPLVAGNIASAAGDYAAHHLGKAIAPKPAA